MIRYTLHQWCKDGERWTSPETFTADTIAHVRQAVIAGYLAGEPRWAEDEQGAVIYGLDARGEATMGVPRYLCRYSDCGVGTVADEDGDVTCPRCRNDLGLPPIGAVS